MSVIVREPTFKDGSGGRVILICKGADSIVYERMTEDSKKSGEFKETQVAVDKYATEGLRTLFLAEKIIDEEDY
jgi:phospholipid-translocating ATPase